MVHLPKQTYHNSMFSEIREYSRYIDGEAQGKLTASLAGGRWSKYVYIWITTAVFAKVRPYKIFKISSQKSRFDIQLFHRCFTVHLKPQNT